MSACQLWWTDFNEHLFYHDKQYIRQSSFDRCQKVLYWKLLEMLFLDNILKFCTLLLQRHSYTKGVRGKRKRAVPLSEFLIEHLIKVRQSMAPKVRFSFADLIYCLQVGKVEKIVCQLTWMLQSKYTLLPSRISCRWALAPRRSDRMGASTRQQQQQEK